MQSRTANFANSDWCIDCDPRARSEDRLLSGRHPDADGRSEDAETDHFPRRTPTPQPHVRQGEDALRRCNSIVNHVHTPPFECILF